MRSLYLAAYDIRDDNRLRHALKAVRVFASGGQKSAHECWLSPADTGVLMNDMRQLIDADEDSFVLVPLDPRRGAVALGRALKPADPDYFYFG